MSRKRSHYDCCYEEMSKGVGGQSQPSEYWDEPMENAFEEAIPYGKGYDQSGMDRR